MTPTSAGAPIGVNYAYKSTIIQNFNSPQMTLKNNILSWIKAGMYHDQKHRNVLIDHQRQRHRDTCSWLFTDPQFEAWLQIDSNPVLWYTAPPGSGKTVLASAVIEHLTKNGHQPGYFFYSFSDPDRIQPLNALRALAVQLLGVVTRDIPDEVVKFYKEEMDRGEEYLFLESLLVKVVNEVLSRCPLVYLVIDGLDECCENDALTRVIEDLVSSSASRRYGMARWFFTSRDDSHIKSLMKKLKAVRISPTPSRISTEIKLFLETEFKSRGKSASQVDCWVDYSDGSFLYAKFISDTLQLKDVPDEDSAVAALHAFPMGHTGYYLRSLFKLCDKSDDEQELVRRVFTMLTGAVQSITWSELLHYLSIRRGSIDHSSGRIPPGDKVKALCGSLLKFDRSSKGSEDDPKVKLYHKTVRDFLLQDPKNMDPKNKDIPEIIRKSEPEKLPVMQKFLVNTAAASREIGLDCLTFLRYKRYESFSNVKGIPELSNRDDAFLRYASRFWFKHLAAEHSAEIFKEVQAFLESPNFWTCLATQTFIAPHLFGRYTREPAGTTYKMGVRGPKWNKEDYIGHPIPIWLEHYPPYGPELDTNFCSFFSDWHEVLASRPGCLDRCIPLSPLTSKLGKVWTNPNRIRVFSPDKALDLSNISNLRWNSPFFVKNRLFIELLYSCSNDNSCRLYYRRIQAFSKSPVVTERAVDTKLNAADLDGGGLSFGYRDADSELLMWIANKLTMSVERIMKQHHQKFQSQIPLKRGSEYPWQVVGTQCNTTTRGKTVLFHVSRTTPAETNKDTSTLNKGSASELDFNSDSYSDSDSDSDSDSVSESDKASESGFDSGYEDSYDGIDDIPRAYRAATDWIILADDTATSSPLWLPLTRDEQKNKGITSTFHPHYPIVVLSFSDNELILVNTDTGASSPQIYPDHLKAEHPNLTYQEFRFSSCGTYLYRLAACFRDEREHIVCQLIVSACRFTKDSDPENRLHHIGFTRKVTYKFCGPIDDLPSRLVLTHWHNNEVVVALPPLTCEPKLVKLSLCGAFESNGEQSIQTLRDPMYFPSSTVERESQLLYHAGSPSKARDHELFLCMAGRARPEKMKGGANAVNRAASAGPVVIRWKIDRNKGWRSWDPALDEKSTELERGGKVCEMLRGCFVDTERRFSVPIRSGLDWTRKGYLSCG